MKRNVDGAKNQRSVAEQTNGGRMDEEWNGKERQKWGPAQHDI